jgi:hypothetical protein
MSSGAKINSSDWLVFWRLRTVTVRRISNVVVDISAGLCQYRRMLGETKKQISLPAQR